MAFSFRKSFKVGPFRTTLTHRGITNSVGASGLRYSKTARFADTGRDRRADPDLIDDSSAQPPATKGNPVLGFLIIALACYGIYSLLT